MASGEQSTRWPSDLMGVLALPLVETFGRPWPRPEFPPKPKRHNPKRDAQAAQKRARKITRRIGK